MRSGIIALSAPDGSTLVAWKKDEQLGWQLYDAKGRPTGSPGSAPVPAMELPVSWTRTATSSSSCSRAAY